MKRAILNHQNYLLIDIYIYIYIISLILAVLLRKNSEVAIIGIVLHIFSLLFQKKYRIFLILFSVTFLSVIIASLIPVMHNKSVYKNDYLPFSSKHWMVMSNSDRSFLKKYYPKAYKMQNTSKICEKVEVGCYWNFDAGSYSPYERTVVMDYYLKKHPQIYMDSKSYEKITKPGSKYRLSTYDYAKTINKQSSVDLRRLIKYRLSDPQKTTSFYAEKFRNSYYDFNFNGFSYYSWWTNYVDAKEVDKKLNLESPILNFFNKNSNDLYFLLFNPLYVAFLVFMFVGLFLRRKKFKSLQLLPATIFIGGFLFHVLLWETNNRYLNIYMFMMMIYSGVGLVDLKHLVSNRLKNRWRK